MTHEVRNLKGDVIQDLDDEKQWYHVSTNTWFLIGGLILFNVGCFFNPNLVDGLFRFFDIRLWQWWYFPILLLVMAFSVPWYLLFQSWDDLDPVDTEIGKQFLRMSVIITAELLFLVLLHATGLLHFLSNSLWYWLGYGVYSHLGLLAFLLICAAVSITVYVVKEWVIIRFQS